MSTDKHIELKIKVDGKSKVAFNTTYGWVSDTSITIDSINETLAISSCNNFLKSLDAVPFENCSSNEEYVDIADDALGHAIDFIADLKSIDKQILYMNMEDAILIEISMVPSYEVNFGEDK